MEKLNICGMDECVGCGVCAYVCPVQCVDMQADKAGFVYPVYDATQCIHCKKCEKHCIGLAQNAQIHSSDAYMLYLRDKEILKDSASGGGAYALAKGIVSNGGAVYGCCFTADYQDAEFNLLTNENELVKMQGSKYFETATMDYRIIKVALNQYTKVLVIGLPCQIATVKKLFPDEKNLFTVAIACYGRSAPLIHKVFLQQIQEKYQSRIIKMSYRDKSKSWLLPSIKICFKNGKKYRIEANLSDERYLREKITRQSCTKCKFKYGYANADMLIGDLWGAESLSSFNAGGTSFALLFNDMGRELLAIASDLLCIEPMSAEFVL